MPRIAPAEAPYPPQIAAELARIMPAGVEPLVLFRTLARNPRVFERMFAGGLLDKGALIAAPARDRDRPHDGAARLPNTNGASTSPSSRRRSASIAEQDRGDRHGSGRCRLLDGRRAGPAGRRRRSGRSPHDRRRDLVEARRAFRRDADPRSDRARGLLPHDQLPLPRARPAPRSYGVRFPAAPRHA